MTALARQGCGNVIRRLAERVGAIVTAGAPRRNPIVIKDGRCGIANCTAMAASTRRSGDGMIDRFSHRDRAVVAGRARCGCLDMVDETQIAPRRCQMTAFAEIRRLRM